MRYNLKEWDAAVSYYMKELKKCKQNRLFVFGDINENVFFSIAPFSHAANELDIELCIRLSTHDNTSFLFDFWTAFEDRCKDKSGRAMEDFLSEAKKIGMDENFFSRPYTLQSRSSIGEMKCYSGWVVKHRWEDLLSTSRSILENVFALIKERFGIGFELVLARKNLDVPLSDYLDSYMICFAKYLQAKKITDMVSMSASTSRMSILENAETTSDLISTLTGLELSKDSDEPIFKKYRILSEQLKLDRIRVNSATFAISGKGYPGKHLFGDKYGYPTSDKKSRWTSPGGIIYKFPWYPQAEHEVREPLSRIGFTQTVPIDIYIESTNVDYDMMRKRNKTITDILNKCDIVYVKSEYSNFEVGLVKPDGTRRLVMGSDSDARFLIDPDYAEQKVGMMANIPGGESFTTPEFVKGTILGDVVIEIDRSYRLDAKEPFVAKAYGKHYEVIDGPEEVIRKFNEKKKESWDRILLQEKNANMPKEIIELKKKNFDGIGEFAINTNPHARLCDYLIVNEKIANMVHVAFGSGFEPDVATEYHMDVVIDSPRQKLNIFGKDKHGNEHWIIRNGKFVI